MAVYFSVDLPASTLLATVVELKVGDSEDTRVPDSEDTRVPDSEDTRVPDSEDTRVPAPYDYCLQLWCKATSFKVTGHGKTKRDT